MGWLRVLKTKYVATQSFLNKEHKGSAFISLHDNNGYTFHVKLIKWKNG